MARKIHVGLGEAGARFVNETTPNPCVAYFGTTQGIKVMHIAFSVIPVKTGIQHQDFPSGFPLLRE
jgi:hypothetical protein